MGTRHLIAVQLGGQYRIAQYGQWDGYPEGQGFKVLDFLHRHNDDQFRSALMRTRFITDAEYEETWKEFGVTPRESLVSIRVAGEHDRKYPSLSRDTGADVLNLVRTCPEIPLLDSISFAADSLFCEYAYVVDLDAGWLEVYRGFNTDPLDSGERFAGLSAAAEVRRSAEYQPVRLWKKCPLSGLPCKSEFLAALGDERGK